MTDSIFEPFFFDSPSGRLFALWRAPADARKSVLCIPPFAEEMNKCRRQMTLTANGLLAKGHAVLLFDLFGTGDSEGEFGAATWAGWKEDVAAALAWLRENGPSLAGIIAVRSGCMLASETLRDGADSVPCSVFWQPVATGSQLMTQFLRLRVAASMMDSGGRESVDALKKRLADGESLEVAGYELSPALWQAVEEAQLADSIGPQLGTLNVLEVGRRGSDKLTGAGERLLTQATALGLSGQGQRFDGDPFWSSTEIVTNRPLANRTVELLTAGERL